VGLRDELILSMIDQPPQERRRSIKCAASHPLRVNLSAEHVLRPTHNSTTREAARTAQKIRFGGCLAGPVPAVNHSERFSTSIDRVLDMVQDEDGLHDRGCPGPAAAQFEQQLPRLEGRDSAFTASADAGMGPVHGFLPG
jgi:hypothetical protein